MRFTSTARRKLSEVLPEAVAAAAWLSITGALVASPRRVGKPLAPPLTDTWAARRGTYRVLYRIDEQELTVLVVDVAHRRDASRTTR